MAWDEGMDGLMVMGWVTQLLGWDTLYLDTLLGYTILVEGAPGMAAGTSPVYR